MQLAEICDAFTLATGWPLQFQTGPQDKKDPFLSCSAPVNPGVRAALGHPRIDLSLPRPDVRTDDPAAARRLVDAIAELAAQLAAAEQIIRNREAELAAGVPVQLTGDESEPLAAKLEEILGGAARACECQAAALYMLDDATSELKMRAAWGLPASRLHDPARPLAGAVADLEALLGHAVALERGAAFGPWRAPEPFSAALCVPVSSPTTPLGTLWMFCHYERDFTDQHTLIAEMTAGRLAAELERVMLLTTLGAVGLSRLI